MKILAPVSRLNEIEAIIEAGADELYCGMLPENWKAQYPSISISRRQEQAAHFKTFEELKAAIHITHDHGLKIYFTFNEHYFTVNQFKLLKSYLEILNTLEIDAIFVSDLALLLYIRDSFPQLEFHISTGGAIFNSETTKFYQSLGATRVILDRHLTLSEIESIAEKNTIETEVFIFGSKCPNVDGFCTFHHGFLTIKEDKTRFGNACMIPYEITVSSPTLEKTELEDLCNSTISLERQHIWANTHIDDRPCGICALYDFQKMGVTSIKIVGRANPSWKKIMDTSFIYNLRKFLDKSPSRTEFNQVAKQSYNLTYKYPCRSSMCYYPEVM
ncbi:MAG: U32 family peptidase [Candidatus Helarchaeota archaeon]|nr:U32 family peptidase [Candidatus Helarchaeota archaeon]